MWQHVDLPAIDAWRVTVLGPLLYVLYTADITSIPSHTTLKPTRAARLLMVQRQLRCIDDVSWWMFSNRLMLNVDKTQFIWLGASGQLEQVNRVQQVVDGVPVSTVDAVRDLGVTFDTQSNTLTALHVAAPVNCDSYGQRDDWSQTTSCAPWYMRSSPVALTIATLSYTVSLPIQSHSSIAGGTTCCCPTDRPRSPKTAHHCNNPCAACYTGYRYLKSSTCTVTVQDRNDGV